MAILTSKTEDTSPSSDDLIYTVNDPGGTPADRKVTLTNAIKKAHGLSDGLIKVATGTMAVATAGTDYTTPSSTETFTNKTFNADGTGNSITNIENADIKAAAAIAVNKLAAVTASRALASDGSGFITPATTTATELGYVNGVTSAIQTQIDGKQPLDSDLTTIAGLTATTDNFIQSKSSAWASRTPAQVKTDLDIPARPAANFIGTTGDYLTIQRFGSVSTANLTNQRAYYSPVYVSKSVGVDRVGMTVTAAASASSTIEIGLYTDSGGRPNTLIDSYGTIDGASATSQEITISKTLAAGWYWVACLSIVTGGTLTVRTIGAMINQVQFTSLANATGTNNFAFIQSSISALPSTATVASQATGMPVIVYRLT